MVVSGAKEKIENKNMKEIKTIIGKKELEIFDDEIYVERVSAMGSCIGGLEFPKKMEIGIIKAYLESGAVESSYMYIDGKEITDNINHNPYKGI